MKDKTGPAFPRPHSSGATSSQGMTLRQYYAGLAMQGLLAGAYYEYDYNLVHRSIKITDDLIEALEEAE